MIYFDSGLHRITECPPICTADNLEKEVIILNRAVRESQAVLNLQRVLPYMFEKTRIVLVNTSHPGNIGSAARAMKTMGLTRLYLVDPKQFPHEKANELASGA